MTSGFVGLVKGLDCSNADRSCNNKEVGLPSRGRHAVTRGNEAVLKKRERSILVCLEIVETESCTFNLQSCFRFMQGIEGKLAYADLLVLVRLLLADSHR